MSAAGSLAPGANRPWRGLAAVGEEMLFLDARRSVQAFAEHDATFDVVLQLADIAPASRAREAGRIASVDTRFTSRRF